MVGFFKRKKEDSNPNDKYDKMKFKYLEISLREYMYTKPEEMEKMKKKIRGNVDNHIKNSKKKNVDDIKLMLEDVKKTKSGELKNENIWSRFSTFGEKAKFVYSEYDRLISALKEEIEKREANEKK